MTAKPEEQEDHNRLTLVSRAEACLDHIRRVRFGASSASYTVDDRGVRLVITIEVRSVGTTSPTAP